MPPSPPSIKLKSDAFSASVAVFRFGSKASNRVAPKPGTSILCLPSRAIATGKLRPILRDFRQFGQNASPEVIVWYNVWRIVDGGI
jgi:hypothetical protein